MPPTNTTSFASHLAPGFREVINLRLSGRQAYYSQYYRVETSMRNYEDWLVGTTLPIAVEKPQGIDIQTFDPLEGSTKRLSHKTYAIGCEITEEAQDDDLYKGNGSALADTPNSMADALAERVELEAHLPFLAGGFDGTTFTVLPDSSGFFATAHAPITGAQGVSQANRPAVDVDLNITSFRAALTQFRKYKNDQGMRVPGYVYPTKMFVPPDLEWDAKEILGSVNRPDTANRVENVTKDEVSLVVDPYLSDDTDEWLLRAEKHHAIFLWRKRPVFDSFDDRKARVAIFVALQRFGFGPIHWLGWFGSPGG